MSKASAAIAAWWRNHHFKQSHLVSKSNPHIVQCSACPRMPALLLALPLDCFTFRLCLPLSCIVCPVTLLNTALCCGQQMCIGSQATGVFAMWNMNTHHRIRQPGKGRPVTGLIGMTLQRERLCRASASEKRQLALQPPCPHRRAALLATTSAAPSLPQSYCCRSAISACKHTGHELSAAEHDGSQAASTRMRPRFLPHNCRQRQPPATAPNRQ